MVPINKEKSHIYIRKYYVIPISPEEIGIIGKNAFEIPIISGKRIVIGNTQKTSIVKNQTRTKQEPNKNQTQILKKNKKHFST